MPAGSVEAYLRKLWFDTVVHDPASLRHLIEAAGGNRVLMGSDFPFDMGLDDPVAAVHSAGLPEDLERMVLGANAEALLTKETRAMKMGRWERTDGVQEGFLIED